jgi:chromosome segregation ATPase
MKKLTLTTIAAIAAFFGKQTSEEMELGETEVQKMNDELHNRSESIKTLTSERDNAIAEQATLKTNITELTTAKTTAETALATAQSRITELETENSELKKNAGAPPAAAVTETDKTNGCEIDDDVKFCSSHSIAENVAYLRSKRNAAKA